MPSEKMCSDGLCLGIYNGNTFVSTIKNSPTISRAVGCGLVVDTQHFGGVADDFFGQIGVVVEGKAVARHQLFQTAFP